MDPRPARSTFAAFVLRFALLTALTLAVLASVTLSASGESAPDAEARSAAQPERAADVNARRYPLQHPPSPAARFTTDSR